MRARAALRFMRSFLAGHKWPSIFGQLGVWRDREASPGGHEACGTPIRAPTYSQELTYYLELLRALPARKHPTAKQRAWGRPLTAFLADGTEKSASGRGETLRALYRGKAQLFRSASARYALPSRHAA